MRNRIHPQILCFLIFMGAVVLPVFADAWQYMGTMPQNRLGAGAVFWQGKIFVFGGVAPTPNGYLAVSRTDIYDVQTGQWTRGADMPIAKSLFATVLVDDEIYLIGGNVYDRLTMLAYNPAADSWSEKAVMPTPRQQVAAEFYAGKIYVFGGSRAQSGAESFAFEAYTPSTNTWEKLPNLPIPLQNCASACVDGKLYAIAGHAIENSANTGDLIMEFDPSAQKWQLVGHTAKPKTDISVVSFKQKLYILGGHPGITDVEEFDPQSRTCACIDHLPSGRCGHNALLADARIFVCNGFQNDIWTYIPQK